MSVLSDYTPDEQRLLMSSLEAAGIAVSAASLGRKRETASEAFAAASYILDSRQEYIGNTLVSSIQLSLEQRSKADEKFPSFIDLAAVPGAEAKALDTLRQVVTLLGEKTTPEEATGFKQWLMNIAVKTSEAGKEGGNFWGRGAVLVNDAERAALDQIAEILGVARPE
jgi:hypothetical protein